MRFYKERPLSPFAVHHHATRGRMVAEAPSPTRTDFQRDRDRIIHSTAFRRLKHKTQVFVEHEGDHYRTRLTHTIEVGQIARSLARIFALDEDLAETLALAHDLGHTPFGHAGEDALDALMQPYGGFDHNAQALRIVTKLEHRYAAYDGLNLTWETLEGLVKHNGPLLDAAGKPTLRYAERGIPAEFLDYDARNPLDLAGYASAEAQCAAIADDIAYNAHDLDDGLRAGLFTMEDLRVLPFLAAMLDEIAAQWPHLHEGRMAHEVMRRVITRMIEDVAAEGERRLIALNPQSAADIRAATAPVIAFSPAMARAEAEMKRFLFQRMYRHPRILPVRSAAVEIITGLFTRHFTGADLLGDMQGALYKGSEAERARAIADYIAGMTDRFAVSEHQRLFDATPPLR